MRLVLCAAAVVSACTGMSEPADLSIRQALNTGETGSDTVGARHALQVQVLKDNVPTSGVIVSWWLGGQSGTISSINSTTDASGNASAVLTLDSRAWRGEGCGEEGLSDVRASVAGGATVRMQVTATPGNVVRIMPASDQAPIGVVSLPIIHAVYATDAHGNQVGNVKIDWAVAPGGGSVTAQTRTSDPGPRRCGDKAALGSQTLSSVPGTSWVTASLHGHPEATPVVFRTTVVSALVRLEEYGDHGFVPDTLIVGTADIVAWRWDACDDICPGPHNVTFEDASLRASSPTELLYTHLHVFTQPGVYRYRCTRHSHDFGSGESGVIVVR